MKKVNFGSTGKQVPAIVMGCMRMKELTVKEAAKLVDAAMAEGVDFFDHADIYGYVDSKQMRNCAGGDVRFF